MHSSKHIFVNAVFGSGLLYLLDYPLFSKELLIIVLFGLFVDLDHLFNQMWKGNLFEPKKMIQQWEATADGCTGELYIFHSYEFMGLFGLASLLHPLFLFAFVGLVLHFICDAIVNFKDTHTFEWFEDYSICYYWYQWRDYPVVSKFLKSVIKIANPKVALNLLALYLFYAYTHPETVIGWLFAKGHLPSLLRWTLEKI